MSQWNSDKIYCIEIQEPWSQAILNGHKKIETRDYVLPSELFGRRIYILESPSGGKSSALGDIVNNPNLIGWFVVDSVVEYRHQDAFEADEHQHLVPKLSKFSWKQGTTSCVYGWVVGATGREVPLSSSNIFATRRLRSIFDITVPFPISFGRVSLGACPHERQH